MKILDNSFDELCYSTQIFNQNDYFCLNTKFDFEIDLDSINCTNKFLNNIIADIKEYLVKFNWIIVDKLTFSFDWMLSQKLYYDYSFRLLEFQKKIIDTFSGIDGIIIDDCQVESINSRVFNVKSSKLFIQLYVYQTCILFKKRLKFVPMCNNKNVYIPISFDINNIEHLKSIHLLCTEGISLDLLYNLGEEEKKEKGLVYYPSVYGYHYSRIADFSDRVIKLEELSNCLTKQSKP